jgi:hypothetical protein
MITAKTYVIHKKEDNIVFGENNLTIELEDDAAGYFFTITDQTGAKVSIDFTEVDELFKTINILKRNVGL